MLPGGQITGRRLTDPAESRQRDRSYERSERMRPSASGSRRPQASKRNGVPSERPCGDCAGSAIGHITTRLAPKLAMRLTPHPPGVTRIRTHGTTPARCRPSCSSADSACVITAIICAAALWVIGRPEAALVTLVGGPIVGYVVCVTLLFAGGNALRSIGASARVHELFIGTTILIGVPVVFALAIVSADPSLGLLATAVAIGWVVLVVGYYVVTD